MSEQSPAKKPLITSSKLSISAPNPAQRGVYASFCAQVYKGNPRFVVKTNNPSEKGDKSKNFGQITAALALPDALACIQFIHMCLLAKDEVKYKMECYGHPYIDGQRQKDAVHEADVIVGRDNSGVIYISVISKIGERDVIKFPFGPSDRRYHKAVAADGSPLDPAMTSRVYAQAWIVMLNELFVLTCHESYEPPPPPNFQRGGNGGGNRQGGWQGNRGGNGGGWQGNRNGGSGGGNGGGYQGGGGGGNSNAGRSEDLGEEDIPF